MVIEVLGSGGAVTTPKIFCSCDSCTQARTNGAKFSRLGPSVFIHGPNILIDTPEEISIQINRSSIESIEACFYSHWHPDHTAGRRVFEAGIDWLGNPPENTSIDLYLTERIAETFENSLGLAEHLSFLQSQGLIDRRVIGNDQEVVINDYTVKPVRLAQEYVFGFMINGGGKKALIIMDELKDWQPSPEILETAFDAVYLPFGIFDINPITGIRILPTDHELFEAENCIGETLELVRELNSARFILSHIEEPDNITLGLARLLEAYYSNETGKNIAIAFDTMSVAL
jgi:phosphoribosyl 1,2-cyclic phosphate phosphodiesterase